MTGLDDGEWHHYLGTKEADGTRILYVDGVAVATGGGGTPIADTATVMMVGENPEANNREWNGDIDDVAIWHRALTEEDIVGIYEQGLLGKSLGDLITGGGLDPFGLSIRRVGNQLEISWNSEGGQQYDLLSELPGNLSDANPPDQWGVFETFSAIAATPPINTLLIGIPADPERYFVVRGGPTPPLKVFSDDFETGQGAWTVTTDGPGATGWELGAPDANLFGGPPAANSGTNCFGTDLDANYVEDTLTRLRSPAIDLSTIASASLVFQQWRDIELMFDKATIRLLDASDLSEIAILEDDIDGSITDGNWEEVTLDFPPEANGKMVILEFVLDSDEFGNLAGYYIDDVCVQGPAL